MHEAPLTTCADGTVARGDRDAQAGATAGRATTATSSGDWVDADGDCQDTRAEVLVAESRVATGGGDRESPAEWFSYYDRETWTDAGDVDIDHLVPLAEAWDSGAKRWTPTPGSGYANDLRDPRTLVAVTDNVNQSKGDQDPGRVAARVRQVPVRRRVGRDQAPLVASGRPPRAARHAPHRLWLPQRTHYRVEGTHRHPLIAGFTRVAER